MVAESGSEDNPSVHICLCYTAAYFLKTPLDFDKLAEVVDMRKQRFPQEGLGKSSKHS